MPDRSEERVLNEHREVCAFLMHMLLEAGEPGHDGQPFTWVDFGCGTARILDAVREGVAEDVRRQLRYRGYDRQTGRDARNRLSEAGLHRDSYIGKLNIARRLDEIEASSADLVTLTNVVHEIPPRDLPGVLIGSVRVLRPNGYLLIYDVERLADRDAWGEETAGTVTGRVGEWSAIAWSRDWIINVIAALLDTLGAKSKPVVGRWIHQQTTGWTAVIRRAELRVTDETTGQAARHVREAVKTALAGQFEDCRAYIDAIIREVEGLGSADDEDRRRVVTERIRRDLPHELRNYYAMSRHTRPREPGAAAFHLPTGTGKPGPRLRDRR